MLPGLLSSAPPLLAQAAPAPAAPAGAPGWTMLVFWGLFMVAMWFLLIAPQRRKQKEHEKLLASVKSGDEVLTSGGIFGTVTNVRDDRLTVRIAEKVSVELSRAHVAAVVNKASA